MDKLCTDCGSRFKPECGEQICERCSAHVANEKAKPFKASTGGG